MTDLAARVIAFYLPQFFPIPQNDKWWGPGFTEWTNVAKARPLFRGHWQPHMPSDLGFYDLRVAETRVQQADMARNAGVEAFCYWHYWFGNGERILERPFEEVLSSGEPDFPFCLAWANQSWTGIWHGSPNTTLLEQKYPGPDDEKAHYAWASRAFHDPRYLRVDGKPLFVVFAPHDLPSTESFVSHWRQLAEQDGLPGLYFVAISNVYKAGVDRYRNSILDPFDAITPLTPQDYLENKRRQRSVIDQGIDGIAQISNRVIRTNFKRPRRFDYADMIRLAFEDMPRENRFLPCVLPNWDNTPRSTRRGVVFEGATPKLFTQLLEKALNIVKTRPAEQRLIFIKAWNEWAEGNYVEPDTRYGRAYLEAIRSVVQKS